MVARAKKIPEQLLLDWPVNETFSEEEFLPSLSNKAAVRWIDVWPRWQRGGENFHCLIIYGPEGCGKTHLSHVWQRISGAVSINADKLSDIDFISGEKLVFVIEDIDRYIGKAGVAEGLFHLYNWVNEQGGYLLLTASKRPKKWKIDLADLSSRMLAAEAVKIKPPDDTLLEAVIVKQFADRQIKLSDKIIGYIIKNADRSFSFIRVLVRELDKVSLSENKKITIPMVKRAIEKLGEG